MLNNISWGTYLTTVIIILAIYEAIIALLFYRPEISAFLQRKSSQSERSIKDIPKTDSSAQEVEVLDSIDAVVADLRGILGKAGKEASKTELLGQLRERLENYAGLRHPAFRAAINNDIVKQARELCGLTFTTGELNEAWELNRL